MKKIIMTIASLLLMTSCATIVHGTKQKVVINSKSNQMIHVYDVYGNEISSGEGNIEVNLPRSNKITLLRTMGAEYTIKVGSETKNLIPATNAAYVFGDFFTLGIGYIVDNATGAGISLLHNGSVADTLEFK